MLEFRKVLIAGSAGFIGSHLTDRYLERGCTVVGVDNLITGAQANLDRARAGERFTFIRSDVAASWDEIIAEVERLQKALGKYGGHTQECGRRRRHGRPRPRTGV